MIATLKNIYIHRRSKCIIEYLTNLIITMTRIKQERKEGRKKREEGVN